MFTRYWGVCICVPSSSLGFIRVCMCACFFSRLHQEKKRTIWMSLTVNIQFQKPKKTKRPDASIFFFCFTLISCESEAESDLAPPELGFSFFLFCFFFFFLAPMSPPGLLTGACKRAHTHPVNRRDKKNARGHNHFNDTTNCLNNDQIQVRFHKQCIYQPTVG